MPDCLFCRIVSKEIPAEIVYEDEATLAFIDIRPTAPGHVLVIPKQHSDGLHDADPVVLGAVIRTVQRLARVLMQALEVEGFNVIQNNGSVANQAIPHLHFHIIPRREGDGLESWHGKVYAEGEREKMGERVRKFLS